MTGFLRRIGVVRKAPTPLTHIEYWVYLPGEQMPPQDRLFAYVLQDRPYATAKMNPIGPREGRLFSDIRLHLAVALRSKNANAFRPDLVSGHAQPTAEILTNLADAKSFVKVRFVSETPVNDLRHVQVVTHLADAIAHLADGLVLYDFGAESLMSRADLEGALRENPDATRAELHTRVVWNQGAEGRIAETRGLVKIGMHEWQTVDMGSDELVLVEAVLQEATNKVWATDERLDELHVEYFGDRFLVMLGKTTRNRRQVRIVREGR